NRLLSSNYFAKPTCNSCNTSRPSSGTASASTRSAAALRFAISPCTWPDTTPITSSRSAEPCNAPLEPHPMPRSRKQSAQFPLHGKVALTTGASQGIGLAIARALARQHCHLVLTGRTLAPLEKAGRELTRDGVRVLAKVCDVRDPESVQSLGASV